MSELKIALVAADRKVWSGEGRMVRARSVDGELGIMPGHAPMLAVLGAGDVTIHSSEGTHTATIDSGFLSVDHDRVTIVADTVTTTARA